MLLRYFALAVAVVSGSDTPVQQQCRVRWPFSRPHSLLCPVQHQQHLLASCGACHQQPSLLYLRLECRVRLVQHLCALLCAPHQMPTTHLSLPLAAGTAGVRRAQAKAGHPLLPDSDDFLGMTASTPEDFQHQHGHLQSALVPADRSAPSTVAAGPSASVFR